MFVAYPSFVTAAEFTVMPANNGRQNEVVFRSNDVIRQERQVIQKKARQKPSAAQGVRYRPLENDPRLDPLDNGYENWLQGVRGDETPPEEIDPIYEAYIKNISPILFSLGEKRLSDETRDALQSIPADQFKSIVRPFEPKNPVDIAHGDLIDPFPTPNENVDKTIGEDAGLRIAVSETNTQLARTLEMGYDALLSGQITGAISLYKRVLEQEPENTQALFGLATSYHRGGQLEEAREVYIQLLSHDPNNWPAMNNFLVLAGEEAPEDALRELKKLEQINPEFSPIAAQIGMIYVQQGELEDGIKYLTRAVILSPDNLSYRYNLAVVLDHVGYKKQAARLYRQLLEANTKGQELPESRQTIQERLAYISSRRLIR